VPNPISPQRKQLNAVATIVSIIGLVLFLSTFVSAALSFGDFSNFDSNVRSMSLRAVVGMIMMIAGGAMKALAYGGAAGSGLTLDPDQARKDLEPWARLRGGLTKDQLDEMGINIPHIVESLTNRTTASGETFADRLRSLHALYKEGILSEEEYSREKQEILDQA
jgi:hypothetical protein